MFDAVWEGSVLAIWLDVCMVAQSRTKVAITVHPSFCSVTNMQWEAWRGHTYRQTHVKLQRALNAWGVFIKAVTRGWIVCPALKMWPTFHRMCCSSELWVAHQHVKTHKHIIVCFYLIHPSNTLMTNRRSLQNTQTRWPRMSLWDREKVQETSYDRPKKSWALRPNHLKIVPTSKRDLRKFCGRDVWFGLCIFFHE